MMLDMLDFSQMSFFDALISVIALPFALAKFIFFTVADFVAFDVLQLGPVLPIPSPFA